MPKQTAQNQKSKPKKLKKKVRADVAKALKGKPGDIILRQSSYFKTVADPWMFRGCKIPDLTLYPSVTFSVTDRRQITVNANGACYITYGTSGATGTLPGGMLIPSRRASGTGNWVVGQFSNASASSPFNPAVDVFPSGGSPVNNTNFVFQQWTTSPASGPAIPSLFEKVRLVSGGVALDYTGTDFDNAGTITAAFAPRNSIIKQNIDNSVANPLANFQNLPDSVIVPVNKNKGAIVRYRPQDFVSLNYASQNSIYNDTLAAGMLGYEETLGGEIYLIVTGATVGKVFQVTATFNYEAIPMFNTIDLFSTETSKSDPLELSATFNALEHVSPVAMGSEEALGASAISSSAPMSTAVEHQKGAPSTEPTLMESLWESVSGGNGISGAIKNVEKVASPLLDAALMFL